MTPDTGTRRLAARIPGTGVAALLLLAACQLSPAAALRVAPAPEGQAMGNSKPTGVGIGTPPLEAAASPSGPGPPPEEDAAQPEVENVEDSEILEKRRGGVLDGLRPKHRVFPGARLLWDHGPRLDLHDGDLTIIFGGRVQVDGATFDEDPGITAAFGEPDPGFDMRRAYVTAGAVFRNRYEFRATVDLADEGNFRDLFVGMLRIPVIGGLRVGYLKEPFGLEVVGSNNDITFMERSLPVALAQTRNLGALMHRRLTGARRVVVALGFYRDTTSDLSVGNGYALTGRVTGLPWYADEGRHLLHLGLAASLRKPNEDIRSISSRPESHQAQVLARTGLFAAQRESKLGLEAATVINSLSFQSELVLNSVDIAGGDDPLFASAYLLGSYVLTGEHRLYRKTVGAFGRVHPDRASGAWELTGRYSFIDLDSGAIQGGTLHDWTAGLNWYVTSYARVMFNYIAANPEGFGVEHIAQIRMQLNF